MAKSVPTKAVLSYDRSGRSIDEMKESDICASIVYCIWRREEIDTT